MRVLDRTAPIRMEGADGDGRRRRVLDSHELLFRQHDAVRRAYVVEDGLVMLHHVFRDGRRQIVDIVGPGELCSCEDGPFHNCTAEALTCCTIRSYDLPRIEASPELQREIAGLMRAAILRMQDHAALLGRKLSLERVASLLARLARIGGGRPDGERGPVRVVLPLTRREIADYLGMTQETVSRGFTQLKRRGAIDYDMPHEVLIGDMRALEALGGSN